MQNRGSGASDMHGKAARVAESEAGAERLNEEKDLRDRPKNFALRIVEMFSVIPKTTEAQVLGKQVLRQAPRSEQTIARRIADAARRNLLELLRFALRA